MRKEIEMLTNEIKKTIGCEKIAVNTYIRDIEEKCKESNKIDIEMYLIEGDNEWIARTNKVITDDCEVTHYYWFSRKPSKDDIGYAEWLADIYNDANIDEVLGGDVEGNKLRGLIRLLNQLRNEYNIK